MRKLTIELHLDSTDFQLKDGETDYQSIQDHLILIAEDIGDGLMNNNIKDTNGKNVGRYFIDSY